MKQSILNPANSSLLTCEITGCRGKPAEGNLSKTEPITSELSSILMAAYEKSYSICDEDGGHILT